MDVNNMTAVEWLVSKILCENKVHMDNEGNLIDNPRTEYINAYKSYVDLSDYVSKALEMEQCHNEMIISETWIQCVGNDGNNFKEARDKIIKQYERKNSK